jgi:predicted transcriptional regulator
MTTLNIRLTEQIEQRLSEEAERENKTRSEIARDALN